MHIYLLLATSLDFSRAFISICNIMFIVNDSEVVGCRYEQSFVLTSILLHAARMS